MIDVRFYEYESDVPLKFVVIHALMGSQTVWCRHHERTTWELPGGHIEPGEAAEEAAARELREETGATRFSLEPACVYSVTKDGTETFGALFRAEISAFGRLENEIAEIAISNDPPGEWTYPEIQPMLLARIEKKTRTASKARSRFLRILAILMVLAMIPLLMFSGFMLHRAYKDKQSFLWTNPISRAIRIWNWHGNRDYAAAMARLQRADPEAADADDIDSYNDREGFWFFCHEDSGGMQSFATGSLWYVNRKGAHLLYRGDDILLLGDQYLRDERIFHFETGEPENRQYFAFVAAPDGPVPLELPDSFDHVRSLTLEKFPCASVESAPYDYCFLTVRDGMLYELTGVEMTLDRFRIIPGAQEILDAIAKEAPTAKITDLIRRDNGIITLNLQHDNGRQRHVYAWMEDGRLFVPRGWAGEVIIEEGPGTAARNIEGLPVIESAPVTPEMLFR